MSLRTRHQGAAIVAKKRQFMDRTLLWCQDNKRLRQLVSHLLASNRLSLHCFTINWALLYYKLNILST